MIPQVELIVEISHCGTNKKRIPDNKIILVRIDYEKTHLQHLVRNAGGVWNRRKQAWELPYREVKALDLYERITEC